MKSFRRGSVPLLGLMLSLGCGASGVSGPDTGGSGGSATAKGGSGGNQSPQPMSGGDAALVSGKGGSGGTTQTDGGAAVLDAPAATSPLTAVVTAGPADDVKRLIRPTDPVQINAAFSGAVVTGAQVEFYVDDLEKTNPTKTMLPLSAGNGQYQATLPPQPANSIVRFRIVATWAGGMGQVSPPAGDPTTWSAYFVNPVIDSKATLYHVFVSAKNWGQMWTNIVPGRVPDKTCQPVDSWDAEVPAVFVMNGEVFDVQARYQGSPYGRARGQTIPVWPGVAPVGGPTPLLALSWSLKFPKTHLFEGRGNIILKKLQQQSCPGADTYVASELNLAAGLPSTRIKRLVRMYVNGNYYEYRMDLEHFDDLIVQRAEGEGKPVGDLYNVDAYSVDQGPWGIGDGRLLLASCNYTPEVRYQTTYERRSNGKKVNDDVKDLIEAMHQARAAGVPAMRTFLDSHFDMKSMLTYLAVRNWPAPHDEAYHNYLLYKEPASGKWTLLATDHDRTFALNDPSASFFIGEEGDKSNNAAAWNYFKDTVFKAYRSEYRARLLELDKTVLSPANVNALLDKYAAMFSVADYTAAPTMKACDPTTAFTAFKKWVTDRHTQLTAQIKP